MAALTTDSLTRTFGDVRALNDVSITVPSGGVVGLVGPNGSGKSTLIRILLGLIRPSSGSAVVLDGRIDQPSSYLDRVGALVESPAFIPGLSARANLASLARLRNLPMSRVGEVLDIVGLTGRDTEPVKQFSLGMKQRLGIAAALLPDPALLILDEPTNGLDPSGIVEIRALLSALANDGRTVVVSSHLMSELEAICDHLIIIKFGNVLYNGTVNDLLGSAATSIVVAPENPDDASALIDALTRGAVAAEATADGSVRITQPGVSGADINRTAFAAGITLAAITTHTRSLEEVFLDMTGRSDGDVSRDRAAQTNDQES
ncbi:ABC transporter ATP-binding protein [Demequina globuliformis]|uniref:ABC transporter ATP-binding protein n=1 Tax=Demequina globuliformis TaxID=676202 RepID=UPI000781DA99|nr:ATP-binding cassette domain-containing protein [Demequina globuliformis]